MRLSEEGLIMKNNLSVFGEKLKEIRKNLGLTQDDVVQKTNGNISRPTLQRYESGKYSPSIETLNFLSDVYQLDLYEYFLTFQKEQLPQIQRVETLFQKNFSPITSYQLLKQLSALLKKDTLPPHLKSYYMRLFMLSKGVHLKFRKNYKKAIADFLAYFVANAYDFKKTPERMTSFRRPKSSTIRLINERLEKFAMELFCNQLKQLEILERVDEIKGLIVDLMR